MKQLSFAVFVLIILSFNEALGQLAPDGKNIFNTSTGYLWNGTNPPTRFTDVTRDATEPTVRIYNPGNSGGVTFEMQDLMSGANWHFKSTEIGDLKIRDHAHQWDVIVVEKNSFPDAIHISSDNFVGIGISSPVARLDVRELYPDEGIVLILGTQDLSHKLILFPGRQNDPNPFIQWKAGDPFRFVTDGGGWSEKMRVSSTGQLAVGTISPDPSAIVDFSSASQGLLPPRMTQAQRESIPNPAAGLLIYQKDETPGVYLNDSAGGWSRMGTHAGHYVGEFYQGGIIISTDHTGKHGLICSVQDLDSTQTWSNVVEVEIGEDAQSDWDGESNSDAIILQQNHSTSAAQLCLDYVYVDSAGSWDDWYCPSIAELGFIANNYYYIQKALDIDENPDTEPLSKGVYWSSTEHNNFKAWAFSTNFTATDVTLIKSDTIKVRAFRAF